MIGSGHKYFRVSGGSLIRQGTNNYLASVVMGSTRQDGDLSNWHYYDKAGAVTESDWAAKINANIPFPGNAAQDNKQVSLALPSMNPEAEQKSAKATLLNSAFCFFPAYRSEQPFWATSQVKTESVNDGLNIFSTELGKPIVCAETSFHNATWLMDVILDEFANGYSKRLEYFNSQLNAAPSNFITVNHSRLLSLLGIEHLNAYKNANMVLSALLGRTSRFIIRSRQNHKRLHFTKSDATSDDSLHVSHLSHGQSSLLGIFCTIMRYADASNPQSLADIKGMVLIDEADAGLHIEYQRTVLPALMHLMPKVQFVITTHSPLLLLGLESTYGVDGVQIIEVPTGRKISGEEFSEFGDAFAAIESTKKFKTSFDELIRQESSKPILLVEGQSDEILIRAAWKKLRKGSDFPFAVSGKLDRTHLRLVLSDIGKTGIDTSLPILALWDFDDAFSDWETLIKKKSGKAQYAEIECRSEHSGLVFKANNGTQVFGALLPVPKFRAEQASRNFGKSSVLSTELLFTDSDLTTLGAIEESSAVGGGKIVKLKSKDKITLANSLALLAGDAFGNFEPLLKLLEELLLPQLSLANDADEKLI